MANDDELHKTINNTIQCKWCRARQEAIVHEDEVEIAIGENEGNCSPREPSRMERGTLEESLVYMDISMTNKIVNLELT